jgi:hypothetical protein
MTTIGAAAPTAAKVTRQQGVPRATLWVALAAIPVGTSRLGSTHQKMVLGCVRPVVDMAVCAKMFVEPQMDHT